MLFARKDRLAYATETLRTACSPEASIDCHARPAGVLPAFTHLESSGALAGGQHDGGATALRLGGATRPRHSGPAWLPTHPGNLLDGGLCLLRGVHHLSTARLDDPGCVDQGGDRGGEAHQTRLLR